MEKINKIVISFIAGASLCSCASSKEDAQKYNVLYFCVDDMCDFVGYLNGYHGTVHTPNIDRLASMGVAFTNAHTAATLSCPSRNAVLTGLRPSTSGLYNNQQWWKPTNPDIITLPQYFKNNGYYTAGAGKIFHHTPGNNPPCSWDEYQDQIFDDPWNFADWSAERFFVDFGYRGEIVPLPDWKPLNGIKGLKIQMDWGPIPNKHDDEYGDLKMVSYAKEFLYRSHTKPFFLALGTFKPHIPWHVPQKYFDMYPIDSIVLPKVRENDLDDIPNIGRILALANKDYHKIKDAGKYKEALQAYLASITFADDILGQVLDILESSKYKNNTIIVFFSDHGWHLGTKEHWHKKTLWEECTRIPFIFYVPGLTKANSICDKPVDLMNIYPTLISLCKLPPKQGLDGVDITPLLKDPKTAWNRPAITEIDINNFAVRSEKYRYIRYKDGGEELYDEDLDPNEWINLAPQDKYKDIIEKHAFYIPQKCAKPQLSKTHFFFDPYAYTFLNRETKQIIYGNK